jgi:hypothetical protein
MAADGNGVWPLYRFAGVWCYVGMELGIDKQYDMIS